MKWIMIFIFGIIINLGYGLFTDNIIAKQIESCVNDQALQSTCLGKIEPNSIVMFGVDKLLEMLVEAQTKTGNSCHINAHVVGEASLTRPDEMKEALLKCGNSCQYGCTHGVMSKVFRLRGEANIAEAGKLCEANSHKIASLDSTACFHGIGHGIAEFASYSLPKSLELCDQLELPTRKRECATGVFMEIFDMNTGDRELPKIDPKLCDEAPLGLKVMCQTTIMNREFIRTKDSAISLEACSKLIDDAKNDCYSALGGETVFVFDRDIEKIWSVCSFDKNGLLPSECIKGVLYSALVVDNKGAFAIDICNHSNKPITNDTCYALLVSKLQGIESPDLEMICVRLKNEGRYECRL